MEKVTIANLADPPYAVEEAVSRLRINVSFLRNDIKKIMVISTMPNEGKSFVSMQLWRQMALAGTKAVLVDMDLRKSVIVEKYGIAPEKGKLVKGTSHYLSGAAEIPEVVCHTNMEDGDILPNVENVVNPSILLEGKRLEELLRKLEGEYRYVLLDSPPLELVSDGERIGNLCDGAVLVVRGGVTSKGMVKRSIQQLERAGCPLLGIVLNRVGGSGSGYYYKRYGGKYYGYGRYGGRYGYGYGAKYGEQYYYGKSSK